MSLTTTTRHATGTGNGVTTDFSFPIKFLDKDHLDVYIDDVLQAIDTDYTVAGEGAEAGGTVTFLSAPSGGPPAESILIIRVTPNEQPSDWIANARFNAQDIEDELDRQRMIEIDTKPTYQTNAGTPEASVTGYSDRGDFCYDSTNSILYHKSSGLGTNTGWEKVTDISDLDLGDMGDVTLTSIADGEVLRWDGSGWVNNTLAELGASAVGHVHATSDITSGTFADARIAESNVTQHEAALTVTESQISDLGTTAAMVADDLSVFAATTSAQLAGVISDETGSGALVFGTSPTLVTPALGTPSALVLTNATGLPEAQVTQHEAALSIGTGQLSAGVQITTKLLQTDGSGNVSAFTGKAYGTVVYDSFGTTASTIQNNYGATAPPTVNDDSVSNYAISSRWIDVTNDKEYVCLDATATAAVWTETTGGNHATSHVTGGSDEIDGDKLDIDWTPSNYTPSTTPTEADSLDNLTAHLYGIDQALGAGGTTLDGLTDTTITGPATSDLLQWNGSAWVDRTLAEAGVAAASHTHTESDITDLGTTVAMVADDLSVFAATTSAQLAGVISDETGSGALVFATSPSLTTPDLGTPSALNLTNATALPEAQVTQHEAALAITESQISDLGTYLTDVVSDTTPQLGGNLDYNSFAIVDSVGDIVLDFDTVGTGGDYIQVKDGNADAGLPVQPSLNAAGSATNVGINLVPKGAGVIQFAGVEAADISTAQTLTNKTIDADNNTVSNIGASEIKPDIVTGQTTAAAFGSGDKFLIVSGGALEQADYDDLPGVGGGLSNVVEDTTPQLGGQLDVNGNAIGDGTRELLTFTEDGSAVNHINIENNSTGAAPIVSAAGDDTNIGLALSGKGTGEVLLGSNTVPGADGAFALGTSSRKFNALWAWEAYLTEGAAPGTPASGNVAVYAKTDGKLYIKDDTGTETDLTDSGSATVTSVAQTVPTGFTISGSPVTTSGTLAVGFDTGYSLPTDASQANWDTAYGWGDHASGGYLTDIVNDTTPQAGGDVDMNSFNLQFDDNHGIQDDSGNWQLLFSKATTAVNYFDLYNAATGSNVKLASAGTDATVNIEIDAKGGGTTIFPSLGGIRASVLESYTDTTDYIDFSTSGQIDFAIGGTVEMTLDAIAGLDLPNGNLVVQTGDIESSSGTVKGTDFANLNTPTEDRLLIWQTSGLDPVLTETSINPANVITTSDAATTSASGIVELATAAETTTGTDTTRALTADGLAGSDFGKTVVSILVSDPGGDAITTGDGKAYWRVPATITGQNLVAVAAAVTTASSSGTPEVQIHNVTDAVDMLSTTLTIDASETDSSTAVTAAVINATNDDVATGDMLRIDIDTSGTGAKGLIVELTFQLP